MFALINLFVMVASAKKFDSCSNVDVFCLFDIDCFVNVIELSTASGASEGVVAVTSGATQETLSKFWEKTHQSQGHRDPKSAGFFQSLTVQVSVASRLRLSVS